jgi:hypothetical protein
VAIQLEAADRLTQVRDKMIMLDNKITDIYQTVKTLEDYLGLVILPQEKMDVPKSEPEETPLEVPLAYTLGTYIERLSNIDAKLTNMMDRLEI